jgi:hypothetical protein
MMDRDMLVICLNKLFSILLINSLLSYTFMSHLLYGRGAETEYFVGSENITAASGVACRQNMQTSLQSIGLSINMSLIPSLNVPNLSTKG